MSKNPIANAIEAGKALYAAGFRGAELIAALAIAGAESGFNADAIGDVDLQTNKWGPSYGLMQIRSLKPAYLHMEPIRDARYLNDPYYNARAAYQISKQGKDFSPWATWMNGAYQSHMKIAGEALQGIDIIKKKIPGTLILVALAVIIIYAFK